MTASICDVARGAGRAATCCLLAMSAVAAAADSQASPSAGELRVDDLFGDHAVLPRDTAFEVHGTAPAGTTVELDLAGHRQKARTTDGGRWSVTIPPLPSGGPHELVVRSDDGSRVVSEDLLVGDLFLCSGQSNMELPVHRALDVWGEVHSAHDPRIRMTKVGRSSSVSPERSWIHPLKWEKPTVETVPHWSALCYFFARDLLPHVDRPIGLIDSSWGGTEIEAWMSRAALERLDGAQARLQILRQFVEDETRGQEEFGALWESWWREASSDPEGREPWQPEAPGPWEPAPEDLGDWKSWSVPELQDFNGMVWYRGELTLTEEQADAPARLVLGAIDEVDQTWINGRVVGNTFGWGSERTYEVPPGALRPGRNVVVTNIFSGWDAGGLVGEPGGRGIQTGAEGGGLVPIDDWMYRSVPGELGFPPRAPWEPIAGLSTLHNAMLAPLRSLPLTGVLWYQGEANIGDGAAYGAKLEGLVRDFRRHGDDLPVLVVQLPNFGIPLETPAESGWAEVREAQRVVASSDPNVGLVVTIDVGDDYDIHPPNKQEIGRRAVRLARSLIYGEDLSVGGPVATSARSEGSEIRVRFEGGTGVLETRGHHRPVGFELCGAGPGSCRFVDARTEGDSVILSVDGSGSERVRYGWADSPIVNLFDEADLPAAPFELPVLPAFP